MRVEPSSTSFRTFVVVPAVALLEQAVRRRRLRPVWAPILVWGYLQYRLVGDRRVRQAGGPRGMSQGFPERLVTDGIYARTRNPMYLGHLIHLTGLALATRSPIALGYLAGAIPWFDARVAADEARLEDRFGHDYVAYRDSVPRWIPRPDRTRRSSHAHR